MLSSVLDPNQTVILQDEAKKNPVVQSIPYSIGKQRDRLFRHSKRLTKDHHLSVAYWKVHNLYVAELRFAEED